MLLETQSAVPSVAVVFKHYFGVIDTQAADGRFAQVLIGNERHVSPWNQVFDRTVAVAGPFHVAIEFVFARGVLLVADDVICDVHDCLFINCK